MRKALLLDGVRHEVVVRTTGERFHIEWEGRTIEGTRRWEGARLVLALGPDGHRAEVHVTRGAGGRLELWLDSQRHVLDEERRGAAGRSGGGGSAGDDALVAPMPAKVVRIAVAPGDAVTEGQTLVVLESMKMELAVTAPRAGRVAKVDAVVGVIVPAGTVLVELEPAAAAEAGGADA
ncbi:MAG: biotin/lipoyl-containing protein [Candidatus Eisenbacteria bacterium]